MTSYENLIAAIVELRLLQLELTNEQSERLIKAQELLRQVAIVVRGEQTQ